MCFAKSVKQFPRSGPFFVDQDEEILQTLGFLKFLNQKVDIREMNIEKAISYNKETMANSDKQGLSIFRETFLLELIKKNILMSNE